VEQILRQAAAFPRQGEKRQLAFYGGSFTAIPVHLQNALLQPAHEAVLRGEIDSVRLSTRPDAVDPETLERLRSYGVRTVELGAQSMDDRVLLLSGRGHRAGDTVNAVRLLRDKGFSVVLQMMTGLPGADPAGDLETAKKLAALRPDGVRVYPTLVLRDTPLAELWERGTYRAQTVEEAVETCAPILDLFRRESIPVMRLGLHPSRELEDKLLAGPYHPALGELVWSRLYRNEAERVLVGERELSRNTTLLVRDRDISKLTGQGKGNLRWLKERFGLDSLTVRTGDLPPGAIAIGKDI
jgi:histone acetyltransferase (RNA polymerase elongator complex component)